MSDDSNFIHLLDDYIFLLGKYKQMSEYSRHLYSNWINCKNQLESLQQQTDRNINLNTKFDLKDCDDHKHKSGIVLSFPSDTWYIIYEDWKPSRKNGDVILKRVFKKKMNCAIQYIIKKLNDIDKL